MGNRKEEGDDMAGPNDYINQFSHADKLYAEAKQNLRTLQALPPRGGRLAQWTARLREAWRARRKDAEKG